MRYNERMTPHVHHPKTKDELLALVQKEIDTRGFGCNLNHIDVSAIKDMRALFNSSDFEGDISEWDVRNVEDAEGMFYGARFNGDISAWRFNPAAQMQEMFMRSAFRGDLRNWTFPTYLQKSNPSPMFGWSPGNRHSKGPWDSLQVPVWPVTLQVLFGYDELTSRDACNEWLQAQPLCRYHWDVLLYEHARPYKSGATWQTPEYWEHLALLIPTLQGLGLPQLEIAEQLHTRWQTRGHEQAVLPLPTLE